MLLQPLTNILHTCSVPHITSSRNTKDKIQDAFRLLFMWEKKWNERRNFAENYFNSVQQLIEGLVGRSVSSWANELTNFRLFKSASVVVENIS